MIIDFGDRYSHEMKNICDAKQMENTKFIFYKGTRLWHKRK